MNKVLIITTENCEACRCIRNIIEDVKQEHPTFTISSYDFTETPEFIKSQVIFTDFPTVVFLNDKNVIKYHFKGTMSKKKVLQLINDINF
ncbi:MAG: TRX family protein [crAssphage sp. isolate ctcc615]|uniref:TRX family protein n=1 Tax=crAssphage sp. isolate ctcc615 TaxID=2989853 RepID=A0A345BP45_9CAUD|nr:MAG: TRX family protein [crAssphage sp. isolate ctcc615]AXF52216.1 MAG: TRX family protein [crAssphage sp. isolate ctcc615]